MAEAIGLAASIIQIAGTGAKLSIALYNFTTSAMRANQDIRDIADDVELTSNALQSVGKVFEMEDAKSIISKQAIRDANNIIQKCESVFNEISEIVEKRRTIGKDGKKSLSLMGKFTFPFKGETIELHRRRLESLKNSLVLLLHVLQLAQGQARGKLERSAVEGEREKIRELHQLHQNSLKSLQALESKLCNVALDDEETLQGSATISRVPTTDMMLAVQTPSLLPPVKRDIHATSKTIAIDSLSKNDSNTSESDATSSDDDEDELSLEALSRCAKHVQKLLKRITLLQNSFDGEQKVFPSRKKHVHEMYRKFCHDFESTIVVENRCFYVPCTYSSKSEAKCKRHMVKQHGWVDDRSRSHKFEDASAHNHFQQFRQYAQPPPQYLPQPQHERPPRPTITVPSPPQQTYFRNPPLPQLPPLHASAKHSIFTPIDDSQSMLAAHWGGGNVDQPRSEASPSQRENRSQSIDTAAMSLSQSNERSTPQSHQAQMANQCIPVTTFESVPATGGVFEEFRRDDTTTTAAPTTPSSNRGLCFVTSGSLANFKPKNNMTLVRRKAMDSFLKEKKSVVPAERSRLNSEASDISWSSNRSRDANTEVSTLPYPTQFGDAATPRDDTINHNDVTNNGTSGGADSSFEFNLHTTSPPIAFNPATTTGSTTATSIPHSLPPTQSDFRLFSPQLDLYESFGTDSDSDANTDSQADEAMSWAYCQRRPQYCSPLWTAPQEQAGSDELRKAKDAMAMARVTANCNSVTMCKRTPDKRMREIDNDENDEERTKKAKREEIVEEDIALEMDDGATGPDEKDIVDVLLEQWTVCVH